MSLFGLVATLAAVALAIVHVVTPLLRFLEGIPRSAWLSLAGGISVSYVFVYLLPELAAAQEHVSRATAEWRVRFAEQHVYVVALAGLATFYGLQRLSETSRGGEPPRGHDSGREPASPREAGTGAGVFWIHIASFAVYNALVGYLLLHLERRTPTELVLFAVAIALHFVVTDFGLHEDHKARYRRAGRWILAAAVLLGLGIGHAVELSEAAASVVTAFLAGGIILNVLKEEMPTQRQSRFWAFALGLGGYTALLLAI